MSKILNLQQVQEMETEMLRCIDQICVDHDLRYYLVCGSVLGAVRHKGPIPWDYDVDITVPLPELPNFCKIMEKELSGTSYRIVMPGDMREKNNITTFPRITLKGINPRKMHIDVFPQIGITDNQNEQVEFVEQLTKAKTLYRDKRVAYTDTGEWWKRLAKQTIMRFKLRNVNAEQQLEKFNTLCSKYPYEEAEFVTNPCGHYGVKNIVPKSYFGTPKRVPYLDMMLPVPERTEEYLIHYYKDYMKYPPQNQIDQMMAYTVILEGN
jgi:lipopolysaccharide cholinephosphotransferase